MVLHSLEICQPVLAITASKSLKCWFPTGHDDDKTEANWKDPEYCVTDGPAIYKESFAPDAVGVAMQPKSGCKILRGRVLVFY